MPPLAFGDVVDVFDDCGDCGDSAEDGEYWDHGFAPLFRFIVCCSEVFRTICIKQTACQKRKIPRNP